jgi:mono/diheme cytochrome c family protein
MLIRLSFVAVLLLIQHASAGPSFAGLSAEALAEAEPAEGKQEPRPHPIVPGFERFGGSDGVEGGRLLLGELNCVTCHKPDAAAAEHLSIKKAPLLAEAGSRLNFDWVRAFIADPQKLKPGATMPQPQITPAEIDALSHFLMSLKRIKPLETWGGPAAKAKELFNRIGCVACHNPLDGPAIAGSVPLPDLRAKFSNAASLAHFVFDPLSIRPSGRMPKMNLTQGEAMALATYFVGLPPREAENPEDAVPGMTYDVYEGGFSKMPDFDALKAAASGVTDKFDVRLAKREENYAIRFRGYLEVPADAVYSFSTHSDDGSVLRIGTTVVVNNDGIHGGQEQSGSIALKAGRHAFSVGFFQGGGGAELRVSVEGPRIPKREIPVQALSHPKSGAPLIREPAAAEARFTPDPALVEKGRELFTVKRCATCHEGVPGTKPLEFKPLAQVKSEGGCLSGKPANFSLSPEQSQAMSAAMKELPSMQKPSPAQRVQRTMISLNCTACHERDRRGGPAPERNALFVTSGDDMGDEGRIAPHLTGVGAKLRREWLQNVLNTGAKVRPYMVTRMPAFGAANLGSLADDFEKADGAAALQASSRDADLVKAGRQLTGTKGMSCVTCHTFQNHKSLGIQGMDLVHMGQRLRRDWFGKYLLDPPSLRPGTRMPTYWPEGRSVRKDILEGDTERQIEALWQYLAEGGKAQIPHGLGPQPIPLIPVDETIIYRNFIQGAGPRAIAVGYPEKVHLAFDAQQMRLALLWHGDFMDASKHWVDRGSGNQSPAGEDLLSMTDGAPFAVLADEKAPWPKPTGHEAGYQFGGYELDKKRRPTFSYSFGKVELRDFFEAVEGKPAGSFKRTLTVESKEPPANLWFRAAVSKKIETKDGVHALDNGLKLKVDAPGVTVRATELLVPVVLKDGLMTIVLTYVW